MYPVKFWLELICPLTKTFWISVCSPNRLNAQFAETTKPLTFTNVWLNADEFSTKEGEAPTISNALTCAIVWTHWAAAHWPRLKAAAAIEQLETQDSTVPTHKLEDGSPFRQIVVPTNLIWLTTPKIATRYWDVTAPCSMPFSSTKTREIDVFWLQYKTTPATLPLAEIFREIFELLITICAYCNVVPITPAASMQLLTFCWMEQLLMVTF